GGLLPLFPGNGLYGGLGLGLGHVRYLSGLGFTPLVLCVIIPGQSDNAHTMPTVLAVARPTPPPARSGAAAVFVGADVYAAGWRPVRWAWGWSVPCSLPFVFGLYALGSVRYHARPV